MEEHYDKRETISAWKTVFNWETLVLSVCPSVTLRYPDRIRWNSSKIISPLVSLGCSLSVDQGRRQG